MVKAGEVDGRTGGMMWVLHALVGPWRMAAGTSGGQVL